MATMRELVIERLLALQQFKVDWSGGMEGAKKSLEQKHVEYLEEVYHMSDSDLLYVLLSLTKEKAVRDEREELG